MTQEISIKGLAPELLAQEGEAVEWKPGNVKNRGELQSALQTLVAFANDLNRIGAPGTVLFGVDGKQLKAGHQDLGLPGLTYEDTDTIEQTLLGWGPSRGEGCPPAGRRAPQDP